VHFFQTTGVISRHPLTSAEQLRPMCAGIPDLRLCPDLEFPAKVTDWADRQPVRDSRRNRGIVNRTSRSSHPSPLTAVVVAVRR